MCLAEEGRTKQSNKKSKDSSKGRPNQGLHNTSYDNLGEHANAT